MGVGGTPVIQSGNHSVSAAVNKAQGGHAACIMLSSFVARDKTLRGASEADFFQRPCLSFSLVLNIFYSKCVSRVALKVSRGTSPYSVIRLASFKYKVCKGPRKSPSWEVAIHKLLMVDEEFLFFFFFFSRLSYQGINLVFVSTHIRLMKDGPLDFSAHQGGTAG